MDIPLLTEEWLVSIRQKLIRFFAAEQCPDPENAADEAIFRVVRAISRGAAISVKLNTYAFAVAIRVAKEKKRETRKRNETELDETTPQTPLPDSSYEDAVHGCLENCLRELLAFDRALIIKYHEGTASGDDMRNRRALAERLNMPLKKLRKEAMRIRQKLERCIEDCLERR